ncbi:MAG TPA: hypothetical protein VE954_07460 [Oligoflexus sp.]|uniref:hypothetical protein n=1 Tax=Oligoflexus sp. TaxID=1971216 RepID=UPI002D6A67EF|nr:hypothetical protein [Oligoflexus sp.]HYX32936.1 hypothetical protein [Oligoflexus sp.]
MANANSQSIDKKNVVLESATKNSGYLSQQLIKAYTIIFKKYGMTVIVREYPPQRGLSELQKGTVDGSVGRAKNLNTVPGLSHLIRVESPSAILFATLWCHVDPKKILAASTNKTIRVTYVRGIIVVADLMKALNNSSVEKIIVNDSLISYKMLQARRTDCMIDSDALLDSETVPVRDLESYYRHDLLANPVYLWLSPKFLPLKKAIEKDSKEFPFEEKWLKRYRPEPKTCEPYSIPNVCPDGVIFK